MIKTDKTTQPIENKGVAYLSVCLWNAGVAQKIKKYFGSL
ncbi:MAG: hypothetical protein BWY44_00015 [Candidatus Omnitrophica bacterium ADurb.Bin292]|jgi:hypothetical protein|nr:MAG: hypothetical protein BWY44_00015 [Candidatus Omnitrophica bacterium ADurb.Bin292]